MHSNEAMASLVPARIARRARRFRRAAFVIAYGGALLVTRLSLYPFQWLNLPDKVFGAQVSKLQLVMAAAQRYEEQGIPVPAGISEVRASLTSGTVHRTWIVTMAAYRNCLATAAWVSALSLIIAAALLHGAAKLQLKALVRRETREDLAITLVGPEEALGPVLFGVQGSRFVPLAILSLISAAVGNAAVGFESIYNPYSTYHSDYWSLYCLSALFTPLPFLVLQLLAVVFVIGFAFSFMQACQVRLACRLTPVSGARDRLLFYLGEFGGLLMALIVLGVIAWGALFIGVAGVMERIGLTYGPWGGRFLRSLALVVISSGLVVYLIRLHIRVLAHQRRSALAEYFQFE